MMDEEKVKELYYQMEHYQKQIKQVRKQLENLNKKESEVNHIKESLNDLAESKQKEILVPINNGIFFKANIEDKQKLLVNVGSDIVVEKSIPDTIAMMDAQLQEILKYQTQMEAEYSELVTKTNMIETEFKKLENDV